MGEAGGSSVPSSGLVALQDTTDVIPTPSLVGSHPAPPQELGFGIFPGQKNHPSTGSCPGYGDT